MKYQIAPSGRVTAAELATEIAAVSNSPLMTGLLNSVGGLLAILDEHRQILALNQKFLELLGIEEPAAVLGLRPGEALQCVHAAEGDDGCGTSDVCSSCGAAVAIVTSLGLNEPVERLCALSAVRNNRQVDMALSVRAHPLDVADQRMILLFVQDVSQQQQRAALERTFFHDMNNTLSLLVGASSMLNRESPSDLSDAVYRSAVQLAREVAIQRRLTEGEGAPYQPAWHTVTTTQVRGDLKAFFGTHVLANDRRLQFAEDARERLVTSDRTLLLRVLCNMVINALEACDDGDSVRMWHECKDEQVAFCVWNAQVIPQDIARRIFQRNFSTKAQPGRGVGTYSMKLFGEEILGGRVWYTSSPTEGTIFRISLPEALSPD